MEIGKDEETLLRIAYRQNGPVSDRIRNAPELLPGLRFYVEVFNLLTTSRPVFQGGIGTIPYSEISKFCEDEGIEGEMREDLFYLIQRLDQFYVDWNSKSIKKKIEAETKNAKPSQGSKPKPRLKRP